ncbi:alpha/beta hydrolase [Leptospira sp. 201903071]|uniref:alpha/beta fold hydrolase n=1 Tax=Leptospira ainazelensis TaxID=2810034 RepID=UPI001964E8D5|nr:alpha/beta hydrolase [Leptospira ainazelensis]MBM9501688.1 alpha/beta hydrolase [Leptospira ainazelensis]
MKFSARLFTRSTIVFLVLISLTLSFYSCSAALVSSALYYERFQSGLEKKEIQVGSYRWTYLEGGKGETILLIHGFGGDKDNWTRFVRTLTGSYHVVLPDLPGFGENDRKPEDEYSILTQVARLDEFAKALGLSKFHIIGNSMGGSISGVYTATFPDKILTLGLFDSAGVKSPIPSEFSVHLSKGKNPLVANNNEEFDYLMNFIFVKPPTIPSFLKGYFSDKSIRNREFNEKIYKEIRSQPSVLEERMKLIQTRTLIVWGDTDRVIHISSSDVLLKGIRNSTRVILKDCGHSPMLERPGETAEIYSKFLKGETDLSSGLK